MILSLKIISIQAAMPALYPNVSATELHIKIPAVQAPRCFRPTSPVHPQS